MPRFIVHHEGAYNFYTTIADGPCYEGALTLKDVESITRREFGQEGLRELPARLARAHLTGCSGIDWTLDDCIRGNRAGPQEAEMPRDEFIRRYLTALPTETKP